MRRCVRSRNLKNEEVMARVGPQRHKKKKLKYEFDRQIEYNRVCACLNYCGWMEF